MYKTYPMDAQETANAYQEIAFLEQDLLLIQSLSERLINENNDVMIGATIMKDEEPQDPKTAYVNSTMGMLAVQINPPDKPNEDVFTWVVDEVSAIRILGIIHESILLEIETIKSEL